MTLRKTAVAVALAMVTSFAVADDCTQETTVVSKPVVKHQHHSHPHKKHSTSKDTHKVKAPKPKVIEPVVVKTTKTFCEVKKPEKPEPFPFPPPGEIIPVPMPIPVEHTKPIAEVPEPSSILLMAAGLFILLFMAARKK